MEENQSKFKTLINNLTPSQRIGIVLGVVIFIGIIILGILLIPTNNNEDMSNDSNSGVSSGSGNSGNSGGSEANGDSGISSEYIDPESTPIAGGDYNDINTYLPHVVYDWDNYYDENENGYYDEGDFVDMTYYIDVSDGNIEISLSSCNDSDSEALARDYLKTIPSDLLAKYTITVLSFYQEEPCE